MRVKENKVFHATSARLVQSPLYNYANESTREKIITDIFWYINSSDYEVLSKTTISPVSLNLLITQNEFKEVSGIIMKGCRNYNLSNKYIVEMCIVLAIKSLNKNGSLYVTKKELIASATNAPGISIHNIQRPYITMLNRVIEPKYDKMSSSELTTMAVKYVLKNKFGCINMLQKLVSMTDKDKKFLKDLYSKNRDNLRDFDNELCKIIKISNKDEVESSNFGVFSWIVDEFIIRYYKLNRSVFVIGKTIEKETLPGTNEPEKIDKQEEITDSKIKEENVIKEIDGELNNIEEAIKESPITNSSDDIDDDDLIMMKILKLRRQLKHTKLELIIKDKE